MRLRLRSCCVLILVWYHVNHDGTVDYIFVIRLEGPSMRQIPTQLLAMITMVSFMVACEKDNTPQTSATPTATNSSGVVMATSPQKTAGPADSASSADTDVLLETGNDSQSPIDGRLPSAVDEKISAGEDWQGQISDAAANVTPPTSLTGEVGSNSDEQKQGLPTNPAREEAENLRSELELVTSQVGARFEIYDDAMREVAGNVQRALMPQLLALRDQHRAAVEALNKLSQVTAEDYDTIRAAAESQVRALNEADKEFAEKVREGLRAMDIEPDW